MDSFRSGTYLIHKNWDPLEEYLSLWQQAELQNLFFFHQKVKGQKSLPHIFASRASAQLP